MTTREPQGITERALWEAFETGIAYDDLHADQKARMDSVHAAIMRALADEVGNTVTCYILHRNRHLPFVVIDETAGTYEYAADPLVLLTANGQLNNEDVPKLIKEKQLKQVLR